MSLVSNPGKKIAVAVLIMLLSVISINLRATENIDYTKLCKDFIVGQTTAPSRIRAFRICDINKDGIPELICSFYTNTSNAIVYSIAGGEFKEVRRLDIYDMFEFYDCPDGLLYVTGGSRYTGDLSVYKVTADDSGSFVSKKIGSVVRRGEGGVEYPNPAEKKYFLGGKEVTEAVFFDFLDMGSPLIEYIPYDESSYPAPGKFFNSMSGEFDVKNRFLSNPTVEYKIGSYAPYDTEYLFEKEYSTWTIYNHLTDLITYDTKPDFLMINGNFIRAPKILRHDGELFLPLRLVCESTGGAVQWVQASPWLSAAWSCRLTAELSIPGRTAILCTKS